MVNGGICSYRHGSQLDEAVHFLEAHRSFVAFVTIDIGANDFPCQTDLSCVPGGVASVQANLPVIMAALREAAGPDVPIVGMSLYNPFLGYWLAGPDGQQFAQATTFDADRARSTTSSKASLRRPGHPRPMSRARSRRPTSRRWSSLPGAGEVPLNVARICMWTWICAPAPYGPDNHANAAGYGVIAQAFADELGY